MKKILITGAGGFLGTSLLKKLSACKETTVYAFTFAFERERETFIKAENIIPVDNSEADTFDYSQIDVMINCAFPRNADSAVISDGLDFVAKVIKNASSEGVGAVINISSQSVYCSTRSNPATENDTPFLETKYAVGKYASELLTNTLCSDIPHTNIRMASLIGPNFDQRVTNKMVDIALEKGELNVNDDSQYFGYLDIEDAVRGILSLLTIPAEKWNSVYNLGDSKTYSLKDIAETISDVFKEERGQDIKIELTSGTKELNSALNGSLLLNDTGFKPEVSLKESIRRILKTRTAE